MKNVIVAPSVLSLDYSMMSEQLDELRTSKAEWLHFDVMDAHFVPNITFGPDLLRGIEKRSKLKMDVHLMVEQPEFLIDLFLKEKVHCLTFHYEVLENEKMIALAKNIQKHGVLAGICFKPKTDVNKILPLLKHFDLVLVMGVEPGFGGQPFMENTPNIIKILKQYINENQLNTLIEVDGGINNETGKLCVEAGVDVLVAGSYVFKSNISENIETLWKL